MRKYVISLKSLCLFLLVIQFSLFSSTYQAQAGGYDEPLHSPADPFQPPGLTQEQMSTLEKRPKPPTLNWNKWGNTYWVNENICRENMGNIICLYPQSAQYLGWRQPDKYKPVKNSAISNHSMR